MGKIFILFLLCNEVISLVQYLFAISSLTQWSSVSFSKYLCWLLNRDEKSSHNRWVWMPEKDVTFTLSACLLCLEAWNVLSLQSCNSSLKIVTYVICLNFFQSPPLLFLPIVLSTVHSILYLIRYLVALYIFILLLFGCLCFLLSCVIKQCIDLVRILWSLVFRGKK